MNFGSFGKDAGPNTPFRAQNPFAQFPIPPSPSPPRPKSPSDFGASESAASPHPGSSRPFPGTLKSNEPSLRWGDGVQTYQRQASPLNDHGGQTYQRPPGLLPQVASSNPKTASFTRTAEVHYTGRTNSPYSQSPIEMNSRSVIESDKSSLIPPRGRSPPPVFQNNLYVGGQHPQSKEVQHPPFPTSILGNQSKVSSSVVITRGTNQSRPMFPPNYADSPLPKRTRSPTLPSTSGASPENSVFNSDGNKRSLIDYRDLDAPEAMPSPPLGFESRSSGRESSRPFSGNRTLYSLNLGSLGAVPHMKRMLSGREPVAPESMFGPVVGLVDMAEHVRPVMIYKIDLMTKDSQVRGAPSPPHVRASQSKHFINNASPLVQEDTSPVLKTTGAYQSGRTIQSKPADVPPPKRTRSPTIPFTSGGVPQNLVIALDGHKREVNSFRAPDFRSQSQSEVAADRPMDFPALKRTKIPLRSSSDQLFEENLDPSEEIERELLAKEKRLARFKDELSQPVQSQPTARNQKVPAKRQLPSTSGTQKLSEDPTTAGIGDSAGGKFSSDSEDLLSSSIVGLCPDMCPESERAERERKGDLDQYERVDGDRNLTSEFLAVKKYTRTAEREADLIRPMPILQKTMGYLLSLLDEPYDDRFLGLYNFLWDRMRAIRMDLRMQHIFNLEAISLLEQMIRLHIIAMHELCEYTKGEGFSEGFDAHLNIEQMNKTSVELFQLYDDHRKRGIHVPSEREFRGYYALLKLDKHPGYKVEPAELSLDLAKMTPEMRQTPEVLFARDVARACRTGNFIAFFRLARKASYLQACLMHAHFSKLHTQALASLHCGLQNNQGIPITLVAKWLGMEEEDIENLLEYYGFSVKDFEEPYMVKENAFLNVENDFPVKRSKLVNRKRSRMIVGDVSFPPRNESYAVEEVKAFQPKKKDQVQKPTPKPSVVPVSITQLHDEEMDDLGSILSPKNHVDKASIALTTLLSPKSHVDKASVALTTPVKEIVGHEAQPAPASPLVLDLSTISSQSRADIARAPKFEPVFRNSFGRSKHEPEEKTPIILERSEENRFPIIPIDSVVDTPVPQPMFTEDSEDEEEQIGGMEEDISDDVTTSYYDKEVEEAKLKLTLRIWKRHAAKKRELRERKQLTANAALSLLSMGPPMWQFEVQPGSFGTFNIDHIMSERREIREKSWSVLNPSEVIAPKLVEKNPDSQCLCWKLILLSHKEGNPNEVSWLQSKLMPANEDGYGDLLVSSPDLSIWRTWVPSQSGVDPTCCLSVIKSISSYDQNESTIAGANSVLFVLSQHVPIELQKKRLHDFVMSLPSDSRLPLLILSGSSKDESDPSDIANLLALDEIDKSRIVISHVTFLKDGEKTKNLDGFLSDEHLREGLKWLASESPPQIFVRGIKTRELVLSHLNSTLENFDDMNIPNSCISAFNEALDRSMKDVADAVRANPVNWPCPEIELLEKSSDEHTSASWYLPSLKWSSASKTEALMRALNDSKLPALEEDLRWLSKGLNIGRDIENQKSRLENCVIRYLTATSRMMGLALAQKEADIVLQKFTWLELHNTSYYIVPRWVSIFRRIFSWRLMSLTSGEVSSTYVLAERYFPTPSSETLDNLESRGIKFLPSYVVYPSLDELVEAGCEPNNMEYEGFQPLLPTTLNGDVVLVENEKMVPEDSGCRGENNDGGGGPMHDAKATQEADKLSKLLEKCNMLQNLIDEKLSIYF
ncbi:germinal-center associated nuclear protein [Phtheirospermum japonicum]|uniref:Germinal-center associated nuclear protein n=1 Tax=Phtheirospermum japonicum TaxID=374723 RepID=A0A830CWK1_9LAMI|nr:germinal-center associated nuclear protein [Phtheirospermum japonicum]